MKQPELNIRTLTVHYSSPDLFLWRWIRIITVIILLLFKVCDGLAGQEGRYVFSHLNVISGLSQNQINCILRDSKGFVWFGTNAGLNRFDGSRIEVFNTESKQNSSIHDNTINAITEDKDGNLWIGTGNGVSILNTKTYEFRRLNYSSTPPGYCGDINYINAVAADVSGNIWIGTNNGLFIRDFKNEGISHFLPDKTNCNSPLNGISSVIGDKHGIIWISTENGYIIRYDQKESKIKQFKIPDHSDPFASCLTRLFIDRDNDVWVGTLKGLYLFDPAREIWKNDFKDKIAENDGLKRIGAISQNVDGLIWVATDGGGAYIIDKKNRSIKNIRYQPFNGEKLSSNGLSFVSCDNEGIVWIGTTKKGVSYYKKNINKFRVYKNRPDERNLTTEYCSLSSSDVNALAEDEKGNLWIGTDGGGLNYLDRKTQKNRRIELKLIKGNNSSSDIIVSLYIDHAKKLWIGTYFGGLHLYDPVSGKFTVYKHSSEDTTSISDDRIYGICEDTDKNLWIGTLASGLNRLDRKTGRFTRYNTHNSNLCFDMITSLYRDKKQVLWISTENGLSCFDENNKKFTSFQNQEGRNSSISDNNVGNCFEDSRGYFWVCTNNGLNLFNRNNNSFRHFTAEDGLPSSSVHAITEDKKGNLWISSKNGVSKLEITNIQNVDLFDYKFTNYNITDGLQGKEFNRSSGLCTSDGEIFFGGPDGLNAFYPDEIVEDTTVAKLIFRDFRIFNKSVPYGQKYNNRIILEKPIFNTDKIALKYEENSFTIEFSALDYFFPEKNVYSYKLEGFDNQWIPSDWKQNSATYTNLNNGTYTFRVNETSGNPGGKEISLTIIVLPPFWKSWIAYIVYAILIFLVLIFLRHLILVRERIKMQIEKERMEAQHLHEIDSLKIKFLTNISHEFRTPLTLIMTPVERLLVELKEKPQEKYLKLIEKNAKRLLKMVNQLLDFRKLEVQGFTLDSSYGDIIAFLGEAVSSFINLGEQKHIQLVYRTRIKELYTNFDKDKLEKIIFNLLSNAFKFTPGNGRVIVTAGLEEKNGKNQLFIKVEDTGIGIPEDKIEKIFTRFFQVDSSGQVEKGAGIGLSLVSEFVKLHDGEIFATSQIGKGTCFTVLLPVSNPGVPNDLPDQNDQKIPAAVFISNNGEKKIPTGKPSLLIAEDNVDLLFYLKDNLLEQYDILEATNGKDALKIIMETGPDLVISDIMMEGLNGIELCRRIKSDRTICHIPIILLTAKCTEEQKLQGIEAGADDYITKPFNFQILEAKIANIISSRKNMRKIFRSKLVIEPRDITVTSLDEQFIQKVLDLVEKNMSNTDYSVEMMSHDLGMSRTLLYKKILALTGKAPLEFLRLLKLKRAANLLSKSQMNISEIAFKVGFNDPKYFSKHFKNEFGILPSKYVGK